MKSMKVLEESVLNNIINEGTKKINLELETIKNLNVNFKWDSNHPQKTNTRYNKMRGKQDSGYRRILRIEKRILKSADMIPIMFSYNPPLMFFEKIEEIRRKMKILQKFVNA